MCLCKRDFRPLFVKEFSVVALFLSFCIDVFFTLDVQTEWCFVQDFRKTADHVLTFWNKKINSASCVDGK